jgi:hypothetical protein
VCARSVLQFFSIEKAEFVLLRGIAAVSLNVGLLTGYPITRGALRRSGRFYLNFCLISSFIVYSFKMSELKIGKIDVYTAELSYSGGIYRLSGGHEYRSFDATASPLILASRAGVRAPLSDYLTSPPMALE